MATTTNTYAEVVEGVRATISAYAQALDDGRTDDIVGTFCPDGGAEIPGSGTHEGRDALREAYGGFEPRSAQRHVVVNTLVTDWDSHEAKAISDFVFVQLGKSGWSIQLVGRYHDTLQNMNGVWRFRRRAITFVH
jgi:hypothetical protein